MKPKRQVEVAELMVSANNFSIAYAKALLVTTPKAELVSERLHEDSKDFSASQLNWISAELERQQSRLSDIEETYGRDQIDLVVANNFLGEILARPATLALIARKNPDLLARFHEISDSIKLGNRE